MLLRIDGKYKNLDVMDCQIVDILRSLAMRGYPVIDRYWVASDLIAPIYGCNGRSAPPLQLMFPEATAESLSKGYLVVRGDRLLERSAMVHQVETCLFMRIKGELNPLDIPTGGLPAYSKSTEFRIPNIDLEIRCDDFDSYEVVSDDMGVIESLQDDFEVTQLFV